MTDLASLDARSFTAAVKARLRDEKGWDEMLDPLIIERTRETLARMIDSIDSQKERVSEQIGDTEDWLKKINALRRWCQSRLDAMAPREAATISNTKETRAWKSFSARLAQALADDDVEALDKLRAPYGGLTAREWLAAREEKQSA